MNNKILYIEQCDFKSFPLGGTLSFAKQFVENIKNEILLVGLANENEPIGIWYEKAIGGKVVQYFAFASVKDVENSKLPKRLFMYLKLKKYIEKLSKENIDLVFTRSPQFVFLISKYKWKKFCFSFAGLGNSVGLSKYKVLRVFGKIYERKLFKDLKRSCDVILAAADQRSIDEKIAKYNLKKDQIVSFPTRFNDEIFFLKDKNKTREELGLSLTKKIIVTTGRLSYIKGWKLLVDSFRIYHSKNRESVFIFLGDGEDRMAIEKYCEIEIKEKSIVLVGRKSHNEISDYLNAADLFVMGSLVEGWPTAMVEAIACGKNIVSSDVSGVYEMIDENENGYVVSTRNPDIFSTEITKALTLPDPNNISFSKAERYSSAKLFDDFNKLCLNDSNN